MTRSELEQEVARATGESLATVRSRGFSMVQSPDLEPLTVDWDELQQVQPARISHSYRRRRTRQSA
jgi:hypothetical protein